MPFLEELEALNRAYSTRTNYLKALNHLLAFRNKSFTTYSREDLVKWLNHARKTVPGSATLYATLIRRFFKWINGDKEYPACVNWMQTTPNREGRVIREDLLTPTEVQEIVRLAPSIKIMTLIHVLADSGGRPSEILGLKIKDIKPDDNGYMIRVHGKTGYRMIRLVESVDNLKLWLSHHPDESSTNAWLFPGQNNQKHFSLTGLRDALRKLSKDAGLTKRVYPYLLRHRRLTDLAKILSSAELKAHAGWRTDMSRVYVHLSGKDVSDKLLKSKE